MRPGYHSPQIDVDVRLNTNEAPTALPAAFHEALHDALDNVAWNRYPDRSSWALREALAERYQRTPEEVFVANGSNEVLQTVMLTFGGAERSAAVFEPTFAMHSQIAKTTNTAVIVGQRSEDLSLDLDEVERVISEHSPNIVFLCSPNNPTGIVDPVGTVDTVLDLMAPTNGLLVVDEAYGQFTNTSAVDTIGEDVPMVVSRTFSKTWAMAGARLGYLLGPAWIVEELYKVVLPYHLDSFKQLAGRTALDFSNAMDAQVAAIVSERKRVLAALADLPVTAWESGANFFLFKAHQMPGNDVWQALVDRSVLVRNTANWPRLENCLRVTIGTKEENDAFLAALTEVLSA